MRPGFYAGVPAGLRALSQYLQINRYSVGRAMFVEKTDLSTIIDCRIPGEYCPTKNTAPSISGKVNF